MSQYSHLVLANEAEFTAEAVREQLPSSLDADWGGSSALESYLRCYGLDVLVSQSGYKCEYRIAKLDLGGSELVVQGFRQQAGSRGTVLLVHGYMDHAGLTRPLAEYLFQQGWDLLIYDLPGHGLSDGTPHSVNDFFDYADQLGALVRQLLPGLQTPLTPMGHSTGGAIITTLMLRDPELIAGLGTRPVLLAPLLRPTHWRSIRRKYLWLRPWLRRVRRIYQHNSHDRDFLTFIRRYDPLQHPWISVRWIGAMLKWVEWVERQESSSFQPLIIQGTEDATVDWQHNLVQFERMFPGAEQVLIESARHNLVNEARRWRSQVFGRLLQSLEQQSGASRRAS